MANNKKKALITGLNGQDGSYLAEFLLSKCYKVYGMVRRSSSPDFWRIKHLLNDVEIVRGDLTDSSSLNHLIKTINPDEIYNLAAQSFVGLSWDQPLLTSDVTGLGVLRLLEAVRDHNKGIKFYQASSSEQFGKVQEIPQTENTPFHPRSPYGISKCFAHHAAVNYMESYGMFCSCGILFNHESPRRGLEFVTRKITDGVVRIYIGLDNELRLGNLEAKRDWGYAKDYVEAMYLMLQKDQPGDYVIATGETHTVREFCEIAFSWVGLNYKDYVVVDPKYLRPAEVDLLLGDYSKAKKELGWEPKTSFKQLVHMMVDADLKRYLKK